MLVLLLGCGAGASTVNDKNDVKWITSSKIVSNASQFSIADQQDVIIGFNNISEVEAIDMINKRGGRVKRLLGRINAISSILSSVEVEKLKKNPNIRYVEPNGKVYISSQSVPWGITRINATSVNSMYNGSGVRVAVIDTGMDYLHPDLHNNYLGGYDYVNEDSDPIDDNGHGTHVSGTIAAENNGIGVVGVAPAAKIFAVKAFNSGGSGLNDDIVPAIYDSADNGAQIISMSWGTIYYYQSVSDAIDYAYNKGVILVAAAGNNGGPIMYPAAYPRVIAVTATNELNGIASFSNFGSDAELSAPGVNIYSTLPGGAYGYMGGTSMATPHVSGVAALILSSDLSLTNNDVRTIMQNNAIDLGSPGRDIYFGYGLVDANKSVFYQTNLPSIRFINGTVIDSVYKTGIMGVKVSINTTNSTTTNSTGFYSFAVTEGAYNLTATFGITYYTNTTTVSTIGKAVAWQDMELLKKPTGNITGSVTG